MSHDQSLIDFHCHLDLYPDFDAVAADCERRRIRTLTVTTTPKAWPRERDMFSEFKFVRPSLGLHPELVAERSDEIRLWEQYVSETKYIGEVGLDGRPRARHSLPDQKTVFQRVLQVCAEHGGKVLTIHSAGIPAETVRMVVAHLPPDRGRVVFHWFTGSASAMREAVAHGGYFSVNPMMLTTEAGRRLVLAIPRDRLLTETDGPFTDTGGRPLRPCDVGATVASLAELLGIQAYDLAGALNRNLKTLLTA